jgi:hypothetical protein
LIESKIVLHNMRIKKVRVPNQKRYICGGSRN